MLCKTIYLLEKERKRKRDKERNRQRDKETKRQKDTETKRQRYEGQFFAFINNIIFNNYFFLNYKIIFF